MTDTTTETPTTKKLKKAVLVENPEAPVQNGNGVFELRMATSNKIPLSLNLPEPLSEALKAVAVERHLSENAIAREIIAEKLGFLILDNNLSRIGKLAGFSKEQKATMRREAAAEKSAKVKKILEAIASGKISNEMLASLGLGDLAK